MVTFSWAIVVCTPNELIRFTAMVLLQTHSQSVLVHLFCPLHNAFHDASAGNANQTNPLGAKYCKLRAPDAPITPKFHIRHGGTVFLYTRVPHFRVVCNEMESKPPISASMFTESLWTMCYSDFSVPKPLAL